MSKLKKATKNFNLGEHAVGGIIRATVRQETNRIVMSVEALDWHDPKCIIRFSWCDTEYDKWHEVIDIALFDMTTSYHADKILQWITDKVNQFELECV